jgi:hypothetical protein
MRRSPMDEDSDAPPPCRSSKLTPSASEVNQEAPPQYHNETRQAARTPGADEDEEYDQEDLHFEGEQGDGGRPTLDDDGAECEDEAGPAQTEISSAMSTRPSSRASDILLDEAHHMSDSSMRDITDGMFIIFSVPLFLLFNTLQTSTWSQTSGPRISSCAARVTMSPIMKVSLMLSNSRMMLTNI